MTLYLILLSIITLEHPMNTLTQKVLRGELFHRIRKKQPYSIELLNIKLIIAEDVFPPDLGATTLYLAKAIQKQKQIYTALDMGCGSGILALHMRQCGIPEVWAADIHKPAIHCTLENSKLNPDLAPIHIIESDLFLNIPSMQFDLIVFNHPYYPTLGKPVFGDNPDGGKEILTRFFMSLEKFSHPNTKILLPFSSMTESEHDPLTIALNLKLFQVDTLLKTQDANGHHTIYEISFNKREQV